jgi:D-tagatose-1,6-bisphosphate aldolase subunit GatZ/KbaZ
MNTIKVGVDNGNYNTKSSEHMLYASGFAMSDREFMKEELALFESAFAAEGLEGAWNRVVAIVVQPGVEFGDNQVFLYNHEKAKKLIDCAASFKRITMEGHSTDYQPKTCLDNMKRDGIAILKVGPALTFALRNALFALEEIEKAVYFKEPAAGFSNFSAVLEKAMLDKPQNWIRHYHGDENTLTLMRKFSLSDRSRYYMDDETVKNATERLFANTNEADIPVGILAQFFPRQCEEVIAGAMEPSARNLVYRQIEYILETYDG